VSYLTFNRQNNNGCNFIIFTTTKNKPALGLVAKIDGKAIGFSYATIGEYFIGENDKIATIIVLSVTEGEDKPLKYPDMFAAADLMLLNKIDKQDYPHFQ
jgi:hypothetical protein